MDEQTRVGEKNSVVKASGDNETQATGAQAKEATAPVRGAGEGDVPVQVTPPPQAQHDNQPPTTEPKAPPAVPLGQTPSTVQVNESVKADRRRSSIGPKGQRSSEATVPCDRVTRPPAMHNVCPTRARGSRAPSTSSLSQVGSLSSTRKQLLAAPDSALTSVTSIGQKMYDRLKPQTVKYMNSYRLDSKHPFHRESVHNVIRDVFLEFFKEVSYDSTTFSVTCSHITAEIRARVKALGFERYKLVCFVQIMEKNNQSMNSIAKFLWDPERDNCASYFYEGSDFVASGAVFGLYYE